MTAFAEGDYDPFSIVIPGEATESVSESETTPETEDLTIPEGGAVHETDNSSAAKSDNSVEKNIILALECEDVIINDTITCIHQRPFLYKDKTYVPFRIIAETLGAQVDYNNENRTVSSERDFYKFEISLDSEKVFVFNDTMFVPLRDMCTDLGFSVFWNDGLISVSEKEHSLSDTETEGYKKMLSYSGYRDKYYVPAHIVDPYKTYSYPQMCEDINYLANAYPEIIKTFSIGTSAEGRNLIAFSLGTGSKKVVMCASMHAREYIATNFIMHMADRYAYAYVNGDTFDNYNVRQLLDKVTLVIIPMVNPDGINLVQNGFESTKNPEYLSGLNTNSYGHRGWKATANAVDLNNNFDLMWVEKGKPSFAGYAGPYAASEPETKAMQDYIMKTDFEVFASLHTQGQVVYWMDPNCDQSLVNITEPHVDRLCKETNFLKMPSDGIIGKSGYMTDYIRYYKKRMAMTIELCPYVGDYPYPEEDFDTVEKPVRNLGLILADIADKIKY